MSDNPELKQIHELLEGSYWLTTLSTDKSYNRTHDDCEGNRGEQLSVMIDRDGDTYIRTLKEGYGLLRFRNGMGGGSSLRVRNALLILAEAIRLDNEDDKGVNDEIIM